MQLSAHTIALLEDIERRIDPETEEDYVQQWRDFWEGRCQDISFVPTRKKISAPGVGLTKLVINDTLKDLEVMLNSQLQLVSKQLAGRHGALGVRGDYGASIIPSAFDGVEIYLMPEDINEWPINRPLASTDHVRRLLDQGVPAFDKGFAKNALDLADLYLEVFSHYPKIQKYVQIYHPDGQGPLDLADLFWGGQIFYELYDDPDLVHDVLKLMNKCYIAYLDKWFEKVPQYDMAVHWDWMQPGNIFIRCDSAMNLSPELFEEFELPYLDELLKYYGSGCIHLCGRGDHWIPIAAANLPNLDGFQFSQPQFNNVQKMIDAAANNGKKILGFAPIAAEHYEQNPNAVRGVIHVEKGWDWSEPGVEQAVCDYSYLKG